MADVGNSTPAAGFPNQIVNNDLPLIIVDYSLVHSYRSTMYSGEVTPIKELTRKFIEKSVRKGQCFVILPFTHHKKLLETKESDSLELETFVPVCHIFPENTHEFEHAPIFTISICEVSYPKKALYLLTLDEKTAYKAKELSYKVITVAEALDILNGVK